MILDPEYAGVCSWRIAAPPYVNSRDWPSGDHETPPTGLSSERTTSDSAPSARLLIRSSDPPDPDPCPPCPPCLPCLPLAPCPPCLPRTNATRDPSGDGTMFDSNAGVVQTAVAALPS